MSDKLIDIESRIAQARKAKSISQANLADRAQISVSHMSDIENGKKQIGIEIFIRIIEALNVSADWILHASNENVKQIHQNELSELPSDCSAKESQALLKIMTDIKSVLRKYNNESK